MCLTPAIIVNPKFVKEHNTYRFCFLNGREYVASWSVHAHFPYDFFNKRRLGVNSTNIDSFVACDLTGDTIPVFIEVPCGHCLECVRSRRNQLFSRMVCEQYGHGDIPALFFTLTYNNEHLPANGSVSVVDMRMFFNRLYLYLRREGYVDDCIRHIYFSEYCPSSGRPHYHGLIFGLDVFKRWPRFLDFCDWFCKVWGKGFTMIKHFEPRGFKYVCKYLLKDNNVPDGKAPNFWFGSRVGGGIGSKALDTHGFVQQALKSRCFKMNLCVNGQMVKFTLPKFLRDKILPALRCMFPEEIFMRIKRLSLNLAKYHAYRSVYGTFEDIEEFDYVFPPNLASKFPFFSYLWDDSIESAISSIRVDYIFNDFQAIQHSIVDDIKFLTNYKFDISDVLKTEQTRNRLNSLYVSYVMKIAADAAEPPERETILKYREDLLKQRIHFC